MVDINEFRTPPGGDDPPPGAAANLLSLMVDGIAEQQELIASVQARVAVLMCEAVRFALRNDRLFVRDETTSESSREEWTRRGLVAEFAAAFHLSERKVSSMLETSEALVAELPETLSALRDGHISLQHAEIMVSQSSGLDAEQTRQFESTAIDVAISTTPPQFKRAAVEVRERLNPESAADRKRTAMQDRYVQVMPCADGMALMNIFGSADVLLSAEAAARHTARSLKTAGDDRTQAQIAIDATTDALLAGFSTGQPPIDTLDAHDVGSIAPAGGATSDKEAAHLEAEGSRCQKSSDTGSQRRTARIRPTVHVTVPVMTLLGRTDEPGALEGYGPIDADTARKLAAEAPSFTRLLTHPETGTVLSVGRDSYAVPADLRRLVEIRDETCGFVGCTRPASQCDIDHRRDWQFGGETSSDNLQPLCTSHHPLKHESTWQVNRADNGTIIWTSPLGRRYAVRPNGEPGFTRVVKFEETEPATVPAAPERKQLPDTPPF